MTQRLTQNDVSATRNHNGSWEVAAIVDGHRASKVYYGYTKRDAIRLFVAEANAEQRRTMGTRKRNAPLKGARAIGSNMTEVEHGDLTILYSYKTPVAFLSSNGGYRTDKKWSVTTSKHISKFFDLHGYDFKGAFKIPQEDLEAFVEAGSVVTPLRRGNPGQRGVAQPPSPDDRYPDPGKFEGETMLAVEMYESAMESGADAEDGDSEGPGYFWLFMDFIASDGSPRHGILEENSQGFITLTEYDTATDAEEAWDEEVQPIIDEWMGEEDDG